MKKLLFALAAAVTLAGLGLAPEPADAKRLGGGRPAGMQRQMPPKQADAPPASPAPNAAPQNPAAAPVAGAAPAAPAQAAGKRSWLGPVAGIAAGLGLAALASHFGFGEGLANLMTMLLIAMVGFMLLRWVMRRMAGAPAPVPARAGGMQLAGAAGAGGPPEPEPTRPMHRTASTTGAAPGAPAKAVPEGFDAEAFERIAKMIFIRLQAANDAGNVDDLRKFTTPELFASLRLDLQERGAAAQQTDVVDLGCAVVDTAQQEGQWIATVRFHGLIRERAEAPAEPFDELWHLVRPVDGSRDWAIAGIQPAA